MEKKEKPKNNMKLKKRIRKTLGSLCLVSAITIASLPVGPTKAVEGLPNDKVKVTLTEEDSRIPEITADTPRYTTGDGIYEFAYVFPKGVLDGDKIALITSYNSNVDPNLSSGLLDIPSTMDAYKHYDPGTGAGSGYVAVNFKDQFLFYKVAEPILDEYGNKTYGEYEQQVDEDGNPVYDAQGNPIMIPVESTLLTEDVMYPCYYRTFGDWGSIDNRSLYIMRKGTTLGSKDPDDYMKVEGPEDWRLANVAVQYINNGGVFAEKGSITTVKMGDNMRGIGDRSFYGCTSIQSVSLGAGIDTIGNSAFANCINMHSFELPSNTNIRIIGDHAFSNCQNLLSYVNPVSVEKLGDYAFENCYNLKTVDLCGGGNVPNLKSIGNHVFVNCRTLEFLEIPYNVNETLDISLVEGCAGLKYISVKNGNTNFVEGLPSVNNWGGVYTIKEFKNTVPEEFFFEGEEGSSVHELCGKTATAFKYMNQEVYEIIIHEKSDDLNSPKATYRVSSANQLILCDIEKGITVVDMPETIGPAKIQEISSTSFQNNCFLEKVYIPSSVLRINEGAFQGCHNLEHVIFNEPVNVKTIGKDAFQTQKVAVHNRQCDGQMEAENPKLTFTGPISYDCVPFTYAMDPTSNINVGNQYKTYITYYSGWPANLTVCYNPATDKNELIDYPSFADITDYADMPYITEPQAAALNSALKNKQDGKKLTQDEEEILDAVLNLQLFQGIESVKEELFVTKENSEINLTALAMNKTITTHSIKDIPARTFEGCRNVESIYINGDTLSIGDYAFENCDKLRNVEISSSVQELGVRPFAGCDVLSDVSFQGSPYFDCENSIVFSLKDGKKNGVVQCLETRGKASGSSTIEAKEMEGVESIAKEAFMDCSGIGSVDLKTSKVGDIPVSAFANTGTLYSVYLPGTCRAIWADAFGKSNVRYLEIPNSVSYIDPDAFYTSENHPDECHNITFFCQDDSNAKVFAEIYTNIDTTSKEQIIKYTVYFMGMDGSVLDKQEVVEGEDAVPPEAPEIPGFIFKGWAPSYESISGNLNIVAQYEVIDPESLKVTVRFIDYDDSILKSTRVEIGKDAEPPLSPTREGYRFTGWRPAFTNIKEDTDIYAQYEKMDSDEFKYNVTFVDHDDTVLKVDRVAIGGKAQPPNNPVREGYIFTGWRPDYSNITADITIYAQYEKIDSENKKFIVRFIDHDDVVLYSQKVDPGEDAITPQAPVREGYVFTGWRPAITNVQKNLDTYAQYEKITNGNLPPGATPLPGTSTTEFYTLTVRNGSGSGSYPAGEKIIIIANDPAKNQEFKEWTVDPTDVKMASKYATATVLEMPAKDVLVTANYKSSASSGIVGSGGNNNGSAGNVGGSNGTNNSTNTNGTTVVINKNGLSNTGVVGVQINGSSDNFVLKISENNTATEEVLRALMAKYSSLDKIVYFPMDITLYDSTGTKQIKDTTGLSVNITLPIPDSMVTYAGNNRAAAVVNGKLQELPVTFKTISGVSCISFTATHFSPYVIYVDTANLKANAIIDSTPKTGDGVHPKWFLSIGLMCMSVVLFLKKDKEQIPTSKKVKAKA